MRAGLSTPLRSRARYRWQLQLRRAESAQRGYLSTLLPAFQADFEEAASQLTPALKRLSQFTGDNPVQKHILDELTSALQSADRGIPRDHCLAQTEH